YSVIFANFSAMLTLDMETSGWPAMHLMDGASRSGVAGNSPTAEKAAELRSAWTDECVFSSMTSFTQCSGTSFTLRRERSERGGAIKDDVEECGHSGTTRAVRSGGESAGEDFRGSLSGVRGLSTHGIFVAAALSGAG